MHGRHTVRSDESLGETGDETKAATLLFDIGDARLGVSEQSFICDFSNCA